MRRDGGVGPGGFERSRLAQIAKTSRLFCQNFLLTQAPKSCQTWYVGDLILYGRSALAFGEARANSEANHEALPPRLPPAHPLIAALIGSKADFNNPSIRRS